MTRKHTTDASPFRKLAALQLDRVCGGASRDVATGLPTGKRKHDPPAAHFTVANTYFAL